MRTYDYVVIGNGLMGSATGRYLSQWSKAVAVIGPGEPADHSSHNGVFSSHYDQGRLTQQLSRDPIWAVLSRQAIRNYPRLEEESGIKFHGPVGRVRAYRPTEQERTEMLAWLAEEQVRLGIESHYFVQGDPRGKALFPFLEFPADYDLLYEPAPAGFVNPRAMLKAQNVIAKAHGADIIEQQVVGVTSTANGVQIVTAEGERFVGQKVLIACGAFTNFNNLLPVPLPLRLKTETTIWAQVSAASAEALKTMPGVSYDIEDPDLDDIYMAPPLLYPNGAYQIKMGCNTKGEQWPTTLAELQSWFQHGESDRDLSAMARALQRQLPNVEFCNITSHRCIVTYTPSGYPMIDQAPGDPYGRLFVATGGNGSGAAGSDTLGHCAAGLMYDGRWLEALPRGPFLASNKWGEHKKVLTKAQARAVGKDGV